MSKIKIRKADKLWSLYIRNRDNWTCQRCGKRYEPPTSALHCSHFYGRGREATRFDEMNTCALCYGCHRYLGSNPEIHREFWLNRIGRAEYDKLTLRANTYCKRDDLMQVLRIEQMLTEQNKML